MYKEQMSKALEEFKKQNEDLAELDEQLRAFQDKKDDIEIPIKVEIGQELDEKMKPKFGNDFKREAELKSRLSDNTEHKALCKNIADTLKDIEKAKRQIRYAEMGFSMYKALCYAGKE